MLLNYGGTDFPSAISLCVAELGGYFDANKMATHIVADSCPMNVTSVTNPGGIIGYNVNYKINVSPIWDITGVTTLTFKIKVNG